MDTYNPTLPLTWQDKLADAYWANKLTFDGITAGAIGGLLLGLVVVAGLSF